MLWSQIRRKNSKKWKHIEINKVWEKGRAFGGFRIVAFNQKSPLISGKMEIIHWLDEILVQKEEEDEETKNSKVLALSLIRI